MTGPVPLVVLGARSERGRLTGARVRLADEAVPLRVTYPCGR
jgi:hypothetical protein